jgi:hypothetical protein
LTDAPALITTKEVNYIMQVGKVFSIIRMAAKFSKAYSQAVKAEQAKDGEVSLLDYLSCFLAALSAMNEEDLTVITQVTK